MLKKFKFFCYSSFEIENVKVQERLGFIYYFSVYSNYANIEILLLEFLLYVYFIESCVRSGCCCSTDLVGLIK